MHRQLCAVSQIGVKLQGIKSAQKQVVAGLNYKLLLETDQGLYDATVYSEKPNSCRTTLVQLARPPVYSLRLVTASG